MTAIAIRRTSRGYTTGEVYPRVRHDRPAWELMHPKYHRTLDEALTTARARLARPSEGDAMTQLSMLAPTLSRAERQTRRERWYALIRPVIRERYRGQLISTDHVWRLMRERPELRIPDGMSSNVMGSLFASWELATHEGHVRSERDGANRNLLTQWRIW